MMLFECHMAVISPSHDCHTVLSHSHPLQLYSNSDVDTRHAKAISICEGCVPTSGVHIEETNVYIAVTHDLVFSIGSHAVDVHTAKVSKLFDSESKGRLLRTIVVGSFKLYHIHTADR